MKRRSTAPPAPERPRSRKPDVNPFATCVEIPSTSVSSVGRPANPSISSWESKILSRISASRSADR